ncbi:MAG: ATP phosphoribosyltransferase [Acutalibacteraceae bacterium]
MNDYINIALPKGRLGEKVYRIFESLGYGCEGVMDDSRKLIFEDDSTGMRYFWVKPSDVAIYVERGAADVGVVGKDILLEYQPDVYELLDLDTGKCRMCVAGKKGFKIDPAKTLRVATKFQRIARSYFMKTGQEIEIIKLNGSIELAPILNMSDVIVDIVETGTTLKENNLEVLTEFVNISARFIANKASYKFKNERICEMKQKLRTMLEEKALSKGAESK